MRVKNKVVKIESVPAAGTRCHVYVLDEYFSKLPQEAFERDNFYVQPLPNCAKGSTAPWFLAKPVGKNFLGKMVTEISNDAKITGRKTNHSLRATGASELYHAGVPEKIIQERTGHLSLTGLRNYECTSDKQQKAVSHILQSKQTTTFLKELVNIAPTSNPVTGPSAMTQMNFSNCSVAIYSGSPPQPTPQGIPTSTSVFTQSEMQQFVSTD